MFTGVEIKSFEYDLIAKMIDPEPEERIPLGNVIEVLKSFSSIDDDFGYVNTNCEPFQ